MARFQTSESTFGVRWLDDQMRVTHTAVRRESVYADSRFANAGRASIEAGYRTYYTAADLAARCHRAALEGRWATTMRFFAGPRLLIIDEVGCLPLASEAAAALFQVISQRYLKGSIALTTNLGVGQWGKSSTTPTSPAPCSTGSYTTPSCSTSTATPSDECRVGCRWAPS